ncbi:MAG: 7-cyano-7-deazaguanine synthase, partial [Candidatus Pacearchaeota archaeon]
KMNKISILKKGIKLGVNYKTTHTCYNPNNAGKSCGKCGSCCERIQSFIENKSVDPIQYQEDWDTVKNRVSNILDKKD